MADETIIETSTPEPVKNPAQERITELSDKVKTTATERDEALSRATAAERKAAFAEGYADIVASNPAAKEFKADIEAKVNSGLTVEDAAYAVLGKAGKLGSVKAPDPINPAGGSAVVTPQQGVKTPQEMSQAERRAQLDKEITWS